MHASKDSMWREMWKILQNFLGSKQGPRAPFWDWTTASNLCLFIRFSAPESYFLFLLVQMLFISLIDMLRIKNINVSCLQIHKNDFCRYVHLNYYIPICQYINLRWSKSNAINQNRNHLSFYTLVLERPFCKLIFTGRYLKMPVSQNHYE